MKYIRRYNDKWLILLPFLLWSVIGFFVSLTNLRRRDFQVVFVLFIGLFGYSFVFYDEAPDSYRYAQEFIRISKFSLASLGDYIYTYYVVENQKIDIYTTIVAVLVSRFTDSAKFLFFVYGIIFGYYFLKSILLFIDNRINTRYLFLIIVVAFAFINPFTNLNGVRFWTATYFFFYYATKYCLCKDRLILFKLLITPLIHFSYIAVISIFFIALAVKNRRLLIVFFIISLFLKEAFSFIDISSFDFLGDFVQTKTALYTSEENFELVNEQNENSSWFIQLNQLLINCYYYCITIYYCLSAKLRYLCRKEAVVNVLFKIVLALGIFVNIGYNIPSLGGRFLVLLNMFLVFFTMIFYHIYPIRTVKFFILMMIPVYLLNLILSFRFMIELVSPMFLLGNPIFIFFDSIKYPIIYYIL